MTEIRYHSPLTHPYLAFSILRVVAKMCLSQTMLVMHVVPLEERARIQGIVGAIFGFATCIGPLICSALTLNVIWRIVFLC